MFLQVALSKAIRRWPLQPEAQVDDCHDRPFGTEKFEKPSNQRLYAIRTGIDDRQIDC